MKYIKLSQGKRAKVDDEDYEELSKRKWSCNNGYAKSYFSYKNGIQTYLWMHRVIMNAPKDKEVDHINCDKLDNRKENLRLCTRMENAKNRKVQKNNSSGCKGVYWSQKRWHARLAVDRKKIRLGCFDSMIDAVKAYDEAVLKYHGEFARTNIPQRKKTPLRVSVFVSLQI
jgi:hypothetical protein